MQRQPAVAGQFYPGSEDKLRAALSQLIPAGVPPQPVMGIISPHAGYLYSGSIAGQLFSRIAIPDTVLIIGPNHHGTGAAAALYPDGEWLTPLGATTVNTRLNTLLLQHTPYIQTALPTSTNIHSKYNSRSSSTCVPIPPFPPSASVMAIISRCGTSAGESPPPSANMAGRC